MKRAYFVSLFLCLTTSLLSQSNPVSLINQTARVASPISASPAGPQAQARILDGYGKLPLSFEANQGQADARVKFLSRTGAYSLFLTGDEAVLTLRGKKPMKGSPRGLKPTSLASLSSTAEAMLLPRTIQGTNSGKNDAADDHTNGAVVRMKLRNANPAAKVTGVDELAGTNNYFIGNDPAKWRSGIPTYAKVKYEGIYPGIDLIYYGNQRQLEYDFVVAPGADLGTIRLGIEGARKLRFDHGNLVLSSASGEVRLRRPYAYQDVNGTRREIHGTYIMTNKTEVGFRLASYDRTKALVIDPVLSYSTYLGGGSIYVGNGIAVDSAGNAYIAGEAFTVGDADAFVTKMNADGTALVYSTYLGGGWFDTGTGIAVDAAGNAYVTGWTESVNFPTVNPIQPTQAGHGDAFVAKVNAAGSALVYSTYLGGSSADTAQAIAVDSEGSAYVTGWTHSADFPTANAIQPTYGGNTDAFVTKINAAGSALVYSTYLGGTGNDLGTSIAVDGSGRANVAGSTNSTDFPTAHAIQPTYGGNSDAFVTKINAAGSALVYSTYLGGTSQDQGYGITMDSADNAYVTGSTCSADFPTANALQLNNHGHCNAFVTKLNSVGSMLVYSTYLGGSFYDHGHAIATDSAGNTYVTGAATSIDFPTANAIQTTYGGGTADAFVTKINAAGSALVYSTYLGGTAGEYGYGIAADSAGSAYITGFTQSKNFPKTIVAFQRSLLGTEDGFVTKIAAKTFLGISPLKLTFGTVPVGTTTVPMKVSLTNNGAGAITIHQIYFTGIQAGDSAETNSCGGSLASGGTCDIWVSVTPSGGKTQSLMVISDSDPASPQTVAVVGSGTVIGLSPARLSFGKQAVGTTSPPQTVTLTNLSNGSLFPPIGIDGVNGGDFSQTNNCYGVAAGASCTITVTFTPTARGARSAVVSVVDPSFFYTRKVSLTGTGTSMATATTLSSLPNPSIYGQAVTFTATVTSSSGAPPDGEIITFMKGTTLLGTGVLSGGSASFMTSTLPAGTNYIKAAYGGDSNFGPSPSKAVQQVVNLYPSHTRLTSSPNPSLYGQPVTLTATVTSAGPAPTGTVTFRMGTFVMGSPTLNSSGVATLTTAKIPARVFRLTSTYNGDASNGKSVSAIWQTVNQISTSMALTSTPNPSALGTSVKFTATLTSNGLLPSGQPVTFGYNGATLGTANVNSKGVATFYTKTLPHGSNPVTATYAGTMNYSPASATVTQVVN